MPDASAMPYHVRTDTGAIHSGHQGQLQAQSACDQANSRAEALDITTRYVVKERDEA